MTAAWTDESRAVEGRPDGQEEAITLYTMHAAKGLEWPIVVPVNTMTQIMAPESAVTDRVSGRFYCAKRDRQQVSHVSRNLSLAFLAPDITEMILTGRQGITLTSERLKAARPLPLDWNDQRILLLD